MAGESLRPTGSTNEDWSILTGGGEKQGRERSAEEQRAAEERLGNVAKNATPRPGEQVEQSEADKARIAELNNQIKQVEHNKSQTEGRLNALLRKNPSEKKGAKKREQLETHIRNAKAAIERHDKKLAELRGELAHLTVGDGAPELTVIQGGAQGAEDAQAPELTVIQGGAQEAAQGAEENQAPELTVIRGGEAK